MIQDISQITHNQIMVEEFEDEPQEEDLRLNYSHLTPSG